MPNTYLITTDQWFLAPDGETYRAVWGTVHEVRTAQEALGISPNARSANWFVLIGDMMVAGCQIHYAIRCDRDYVDFGNPGWCEIDHEGQRLVGQNASTRIYDADDSGLVALPISESF